MECEVTEVTVRMSASDAHSLCDAAKKIIRGDVRSVEELANHEIDALNGLWEALDGSI